MKTALHLLLLTAFLGCSLPSKKPELDPAQPQADVSTNPRLGLLGDFNETRIVEKRPSFKETTEERDLKNGKKELVYLYTLRVQLRCTLDGRIEAPLRGKKIKWSWDGVKNSVSVTDTEGFLDVTHESPQPVLSRQFRYQVGKAKGAISLLDGPYLIVLVGEQCQ